MALFTGTVEKGLQNGRTIGFPTLNLQPDVLADEQLEKGVYAARVWLRDQTLLGALYYGPRLVLGENQDVLEIFLLDFSDDVYGESVAFQLGPFIRGVMAFATLDELKTQLADDVTQVRQTPML